MVRRNKRKRVKSFSRKNMEELNFLQKESLILAYGPNCCFCQKNFNPKNLLLHRITSHKEGGTLTIDNAIITCQKCKSNILLFYDTQEYWELVRKALEWSKKRTEERKKDILG